MTVVNDRLCSVRYQGDAPACPAEPGPRRTPDGQHHGFAARIREIVEAHEFRVWFDTVRRIGPLGHAASDAAYEALAAAGSIGDDPVLGAEEVLALDRARDLLLGER